MTKSKTQLPASRRQLPKTPTGIPRLDAMLGGGGMAVLKDVKSRPPNRTAIILTSFPYQEYREAYLAAGADYFFDKTRDIQKLTDVLVELASKIGGSTDE